MRKSIYFLLANILSFIGAWIVSEKLGTVGGVVFFNFNGIVTSIATGVYPIFRFVFPVVLLSIIFAIYDLGSEKKHPLLTKITDIAGTVITVVTIYVTWLSILVAYGDITSLTSRIEYGMGSEVVFPWLFTISFFVSLAIMLTSNVFSKKNPELAFGLIILGFLGMISGLVYHFYLYANSPYWYVALICYGVSVLATALYLLPALHMRKKALSR